ncbi:hypothetical protein HL658_18205 [Azospirillum sp. RWY-5-1]|uniref:Uncharacterized protein n=1 Tax=Azospirillum oleiclasticum TaxID=2735135 RepID=A0ABX2TG07_9PROT|nr:hypothetical protein [Azospirillum oleiclasticum]NYZ14487.1 hypothetical protein [Azospirillum oleiclasticum]NYZ23161.1 hypothetical protein [Azospirillum oleiclasticum]
MRSFHKATIASLMAAGLAVAAGAAVAQTSGQGGNTQQTNPTGALPDNSLAGQRQGTMGGGTTPQTGTPGGSSGSSSAPTGTMPDNSLAGQRQGVIGGGSVTQGGSGSTQSPSQQQPPQGGTGQ